MIMDLENVIGWLESKLNDIAIHLIVVRIFLLCGHNSVCWRTVNAGSFLKFAGSVMFPVTNRDTVY